MFNQAAKSLPGVRIAHPLRGAAKVHKNDGSPSVLTPSWGGEITLSADA
jgi:hypothetical protein